MGATRFLISFITCWLAVSLASIKLAYAESRQSQVAPQSTQLDTYTNPKWVVSGRLSAARPTAHTQFTSDVGSPHTSSESSGELAIASASSHPSLASTFTASLDEIQAKLPSTWAVRLPSPDSLTELFPDPASYSVRVFAFDQPPAIAISLFQCDSGAPACQLATITVDSSTSRDTQQALRRHQQGMSYFLDMDVQGYVLTGTDPGDPSGSSLMWQQDGLIYTVSFPTQHQHVWVAIARSMTHALPLSAVARHTSAPDAESALGLSQSPPSSEAPDNVRNETPDEVHETLDEVHETPNDAIAQPHPEPLSTISPSSLNIPRPSAQPLPTTTNPRMGQVTSVAQLTDVQPTDWAFQALQSLVERYGVIAGYPDQTFRGDRPLTRYEFAAGLNATLDRIQDLIQAGLADQVTADDLETISRLQDEFSAELTTLGGRLDTVSDRLAVVESQQFSTTFKLFGESIFALAAAVGGDPPGQGDSGPIFAQQTQLNLVGSFTEGRDLFRMGLSAGNFEDLGFASPDALNTYMALLSFQADTNNDLDLSSLEYRVAAGDRLVFTIKPVGFDLSDVLSPNSPLSSSGQEAISRFAEESPLFRIGALDAGLGLDWLVANRVRLQVGYGSRDASDPDRGLYGNDHNTLGVQILFTPVDELIAGIAYINGFSRDGRLDTATGSFNADTSGGFNEFARIHGVNGTLQWQITDTFTLGAWGGLVYTDSMESSARAGSSTYAVSLSLLNPFGRENDLLAFFLGQPLRLFAGDRIERVDDATSLHFEVFYRFRLNDFISITPGFFYVTNPGHIDDNNGIAIGTIRTTFSF
ncbi:MAG: iron uptake porin [Elainellaceae cyanobacterium]